MKVGEVTYDELPKELILTVVNDADKDFVVERDHEDRPDRAEGAFGDGKISSRRWTRSTPCVAARRRANDLASVAAAGTG